MTETTSASPSATGPALEGLTVVDLSGSYAGPTATRYLADLGASVIKVEPLTGDDSRQWGPPFVGQNSAWYLSANIGKRSLAIDLVSAEGREILYRLLERSDILVESFNPSKLSRLGLDPAFIRRRFPRLIYCAISGFGLEGPDRDRPGYDLIAQARSGMMSVTGSARHDPQRVGTALSDVATGMMASLAVCAAAVRQQRTGEGDLLDISLIATDLALMNPRISSFLAGEPEPHPCSGQDSVLAIYQRFDTADRPLVVSVGNDRAWERFCRATGLEELLHRTELADNRGRREHRAELVELVGHRFLEHTASEWSERLKAANISHSEVLTLSEVVDDAHIRESGLLVKSTTPEGQQFESVATPWVMDQDRRPRDGVRHPPSLGEHTAEVLMEIGLCPDDVNRLDESNIIVRGAALS